jgi:RNA recognition motif-containing protein
MNPLEPPPSDNLYITGLPKEFDTDAVYQFFSACGSVIEAKTLGHGNALVRFSNVEEASMVKDAMTGQQPPGCTKPLGFTFAAADHKKQDWTCPSCGDLQFARNASCRKCGAAKPSDVSLKNMGLLGPKGEQGKDKGTGKGMLGKAKGLTANGDWMCPDCNDLQFARNEICRMCGRPKEGWNESDYAAWHAQGGEWGPYGKGKGKGKKGVFFAPGIKGLVDSLIAEGLPGGKFDQNQNALYLTNLPYDVTAEDLYTVFGCFGAIPPRGVRVMPGTPGARCYGFVNFLDQTAAEFAVMAMNGVTQPDGYKLIVKLKNQNTSEQFGTGSLLPIDNSLPKDINPIMLARIQKKLKEGKMSSYDISQWYICEYLENIEEEEDMKANCDALLSVCSYIGL